MMALVKTEHGVNTYTIVSKDQSTSMTLLPERGGCGSSLIMPTPNGPRELLFQHDFFWQDNWHDLPGGWPFLFPVCARLERNGRPGAYLYNGHIYNLKIHGFSWYLPWSVIDETSDSITLMLRANEETLSIYPFNFEVRLHYHIAHAELTCHQTYINHDRTAMPYYAGFHPYFKTPALGHGKEKVMLNYHPVKQLQYNSTLTDIVGEKDLLTLPISITDPAASEQLTQLGADKTASLHYPDDLILQISAEGVEDPDLFPYLQLYTMREKDFFCVEHWMAFPNAMNTVQGVRWLSPGTQEHGLLKLKLTHHFR